MHDEVVEMVCPQLQQPRDVRHLSAVITDVVGVTTVEVDLPTCRIRVCGSATAMDLRAAGLRAGYTLLILPVGSPPDRGPAMPTAARPGELADRPPAP